MKMTIDRFMMYKMPNKICNHKMNRNSEVIISCKHKSKLLTRNICNTTKRNKKLVEGTKQTKVYY
jgi:hypothetical protein